LKQQNYPNPRIKKSTKKKITQPNTMMSIRKSTN